MSKVVKRNPVSTPNKGGIAFGFGSRMGKNDTAEI